MISKVVVLVWFPCWSLHRFCWRKWFVIFWWFFFLTNYLLVVFFLWLIIGHIQDNWIQANQDNWFFAGSSAFYFLAFYPQATFWYHSRDSYKRTFLSFPDVQTLLRMEFWFKSYLGCGWKDYSDLEKPFNCPDNLPEQTNPHLHHISLLPRPNLLYNSLCLKSLCWKNRTMDRIVVSLWYSWSR